MGLGDSQAGEPRHDVQAIQVMLENRTHRLIPTPSRAPIPGVISCLVGTVEVPHAIIEARGMPGVPGV